MLSKYGVSETSLCLSSYKDKPFKGKYFFVKKNAIVQIIYTWILFQYANRYWSSFTGKIFNLVRRTIKVKEMMKNYVISNNNATYYCSNTLLGRKLARCNISSSFVIFNRCFYSSSSEFQLFDDYKDITSETINKLLINQQVFISPEEFSKIKDLPVVKFDLPISDQIYSSFAVLVGRPNSWGWRPGVYIFTYKPTGDKYVGSSNNLSRRLDQYFTFKHIDQKKTLENYCL